MLKDATRFLAFVLVAVLAACGQAPLPDGVTDVQILGGDRNLPVGSTTLLRALVSGKGVATTTTWSGGDALVATIDGDGLVTAVASGSTTVTATSTAEGMLPAAVADQPVDITGPEEALYTRSFVTWVHAAAPVTVQTIGAGCEVEGDVLDVDVALESGWNQLAWSVVLTEEPDPVAGFRLRNSDVEAVFISPIFFF